MQESKLLGSLIMVLPELQAIAQEMREKYGIPAVDPGEDGLTKLMLTEEEIDWDAVQKDISAHIGANANLLPPEYAPYLALRKQAELPDVPDIFEPISDDFRAKVTSLYKFYVTTMKAQLPMYLKAIDRYYGTLTTIVKEFLLTGKGTPVPDDWFGRVGVSSAGGEPVVFAMANMPTDHRGIVAEFRSELTNTFGKQKRRVITDEDLSSAEYIPLHLSGKTYAEIVRIDKKLHPDKYRWDKKKRKYEPTAITHKETMRKRFQRLKEFIREFDRDRKS